MDTTVLDIEPRRFMEMSDERKEDMLGKLIREHTRLGEQIGGLIVLRSVALLRARFPDGIEAELRVDILEGGYSVTIERILDATGLSVYDWEYQTAAEAEKIDGIEVELSDAANLGHPFGNINKIVKLPLIVR